MRLRGLIRWDLVRRDLRRGGVVVVVAAVGLVVLVHAMNRVDEAETKASYGSAEPIAPNLDTLPPIGDDLPHTSRTLTVAVQFARNQDGSYQVTSTATVVVAPDDPVVDPIETRTGIWNEAVSSLFSSATLQDAQRDERHWLQVSALYLERTATSVHIVLDETGRLDAEDRHFSVEPAPDIEEQYISVSTADLMIEAVHGTTPITQTADSVHAMLRSYVGRPPEHDTLTIDFSPPTTTPKPATVIRYVSNSLVVQLALGLPLILVALTSTSTIPALRRLRGVLIVTLVAITGIWLGPPTRAISYALRYNDLAYSLLLFVLPIALFLGLRAARGTDVLAHRFAAFPGAVVAIALSLSVAELADMHVPLANAMVILSAVGAVALLTAVVGRILHPRAWLLGSALGAAFAIGSIMSVARAHPLTGLGDGLSISTGTALLWVPAALAFTGCVSNQWSWKGLAIAALVPFLACLPIAVRPVPQLVSWHWPYTLTCLVLILIAAFTFLRRIGADHSAYADPWSRRLAIATVMFSYGAFAALSARQAQPASEPVLLAGAAAALLLPRSRIMRAVDLGTVDRAKHSENMAYEIRRRLLRASESDYIRSAREKLATGELTVRAFRNGFRRFQPPGPPVHSATENALGSPAGATPWRNGVVAALLGLLLAVPTAILLDPGMTNLHVLEQSLSFPGLIYPFDTAVSVFRWVAFAFIYGYFYPRLPGRTAVAKSGGLILAILVPRLADILVYAQPATGGLAVPALIATAQCLVFGLSLGLLWEMRLARLADVPWTRVRNIRSLKAVAVPATTISVAAAVAAATALTNYAMAPITTPPKPGASVSSPAPSPARSQPQGGPGQNEVAPPSDGATR